MGENGIVRVSIQREDAELGTVYPVVFKRADVAGGSSVYEVVHQIEFDRQEKMNRDRRGGAALTVVETDQKIPADALERIQALYGVLGATYYEKEED